MITKAEAEQRILKEFRTRPPVEILNSFIAEYMRMHNKVYPWMKPAEKQKPQQLKLF